MTDNNLDWDSRSQACIAQGYNTEEMATNLYGGSLFAPAHIKSAHGCTLLDAFDRRYVDYTCGNGTNVLGYGHSIIAKAISDAAARGALISAFATEDEVTTAEKIKEFFPFLEVLKFNSSLKESYDLATAVAVAKTGRSEVSYDINKATEKTACVFIDPTISDSEKANMKLLEYMRIRCDDLGALLVFDESLSAFRHKNGSVSNSHGVTPDLLILGGPLGGGLFLSAVGGKTEIMNSNEYRVTNNFAADSVVLSACREFLHQIKQKDIKELWQSGERFIKQFNTVAEGVAKIRGMPTYGRIAAPQKFFQMCASSGIIFGPRFFFSFPLVEETEKTLSIVGDVCLQIKTEAAK